MHCGVGYGFNTIFQDNGRFITNQIEIDTNVDKKFIWTKYMLPYVQKKFKLRTIMRHITITILRSEDGILYQLSYGHEIPVMKVKEKLNKLKILAYIHRDIEPKLFHTHISFYNNRIEIDNNGCSFTYISPSVSSKRSKIYAYTMSNSKKEVDNSGKKIKNVLEKKRANHKNKKMKQMLQITFNMHKLIKDDNFTGKKIYFSGKKSQ